MTNAQARTIERLTSGQRSRQLAGATIGNMVGLTPAVMSVFGLFLIPLSETFGWPRAAISGVLGVISAGAALVTPFAGRLADRHGARRLLIGGNIVFAAAIALLALSNGSLAQFYATFALIAVSSPFVNSPILAKVVSDSYQRHRGAALGFSLGFGHGFGATLLPALAAFSLGVLGWRGAYLTVAATVLLLGLLAYSILIRDRLRSATEGTSAVAAGETLGQAARTRAFWLMIVAIAPAAGCTTAVFSHIVPILAERKIDLGLATAVLAVLAMGTASWQMVVGVIFDRVPTPLIVAPPYLASVAGIALLGWGEGTLILMAAGGLIAIGLGTQFSSLPFLISRYFGLAHFGAILGASYSAVYVLQGLTPILLDYAFDVQGTYRTALIAICLCLVVCALLLLLLPAYKYDVEPEAAATLHA